MKKPPVFHIVLFLILPVIVVQGQSFYTGAHDFRQIQQAFYEGFQGAGSDTAEWSEFNGFRRWELFWGPRTMPSGDIDLAAARYAEAVKHINRSPRNAVPAKNYWTELGPKRNGLGGVGRIDAIAFHPSDTNILYAGSPAGGLWASYDGGHHWQNLNTDQQLPSLGVSSIAIDPNDPAVIFIATGDVDGRYTYSCGIYKSADGGQTWNKAGLNDIPVPFTIGKILLHPGEPEVAFAATSRGIYRTPDRNGEMPVWEKVFPAEADSFQYIRNMDCHPGDPLKFYAVGIDILASVQDGTAGTWYRTATSENGLDFTGTPWPAVFDGEEYVSSLNMTLAPQGDFLYVNCITRDDPPPHNWQSEVHKHIFRYDIAGDLWEIMPTAYLFSGITPGRMAMVVSPSDSKRIYCGGVRLKVFDPDTPEHPWHMVDYHSHIDFHELLFSPWEANVLFAGTDGGVYKKNMTSGPAFIDATGENDENAENVDGGFYRKNATGFANGYPTVELNNGLGVSTMYNFASSPLDPYQILAGYQDCGICYLKNDIWRSQENPSDGFQCLMDAADSNLMYCTIYHPTNGSLYRSVSDTEDPSWQNVFNGQSPVNESSWFGASLVADPANTKTLFQARINLWKTDDASTATIFDWYRITDTDMLTSAAWGNDNCVVFALEIAPSAPDHIYFSGVKIDSWVTHFDANKVFKTTVGGGTNPGDWTDITPPSPGNPLGTYFITDIAVSAADPDKIWVTYSGFLENYKVKCFDGLDWYDLNEGLPNIPINCIVYVNGSNEALFVGTDVGVYFRDASMDHWEPFMTGLPNVKVSWLEVNYTNWKLRAGTFGRGLWENNLPAQCLPSRTQVMLQTTGNKRNLQTYFKEDFPGVKIRVIPNPSFAGNVTVSVQPNACEILNEHSGPDDDDSFLLRIYNMTGGIVKNDIVEPGNLFRNIDVSQWPEGVYFVLVFHRGMLSGKAKFVVK